MAEVACRGARLVAIAREALEREHEPPARWAEEAAWLRESRATFVTLRLDGELRGCIGTIDARRPLGEDVAANARAAAYRDPRFPPVGDAERAALEIEVSVLSPRMPLAAASEAEALAQLRPGVDGVYFQYGSASATFLPQVWENIPDPRDFLDALRHKAGLPAGFWHPDVRLSRYTVEKFA
jgi:AmmeMemoRadiSam system protein A